MKTSSSLWKKLLSEKLKRLARSDNPRLAVLGIGNELNGDDSAGNRAAQSLARWAEGQPIFFVMNCGTIPEHAAGLLRKFKPAVVIIIDAAEMELPPGRICWLSMDEIGGFSASSHTLPLSVSALYLQLELNCEIAILGIQPGSLEFENPLTKPVKRAVNSVVSEIKGNFGFIKATGQPE